MRWVVLAIVAFVVVYTVVEIRSRKPHASHEPYAEAKQREAQARMHDAGWVKMPLAVRRPVEKPPGGEAASVSRGALGLGLDLPSLFPDRPALLASIDDVTAPVNVKQGEDYTVYFTASVADQKFQLGGSQLYRHGQDLVLVPSLEKLPDGGVLSRWHDANYAITFPTDGMAAGTYHLRLIANGPAATWTFVVK